MNLVIQKVRGVDYVYLRESFWDPVRKKYSSRNVKSFGRLDLLEKDNPQILEQLRQRVKQDHARSEEQKKLLIKQRVEQFKKQDSTGGYKDNLSVCLGQVVYRQIWNNLGLQRKLRQLQEPTKSNFNFAEAIFFLLTARTLMPDSKLGQWQNKNQFLFGAPQLSLNDLYRSLDLLISHKDSLIQYLNGQITKKYKRKISVALYDVTTYYFESQDVDTLRNFGFSKDNKVNQVQVVMGLLIDDNGIPIDYELYPGNTSEFGTMIPLLKKLQAQYKVKRVIVTADRGLNSGANLRAIKELGMEYVIAYRLRNASDSIRKLILSDKGWTHWNSPGNAISKFRTATETRTVKYLDENGKEQQDKITSQLLINYSSKRALKDAADRARLIKKAQRLQENPALLQSEMHRGGKSYLKLTSSLEAEIDVEKIKKAELFDGYYGIVYSDPNLTPDEVIRIHHSLWKIEQSFRISKSLMDARPCFHWKENRIRAHFLICFMALVLHRLLEYELYQAHIELSAERIIEALRNATLLKVDLPKGESLYCKSFTNGDFETIAKVVQLGELETVANKVQVKKALHLKGLD